jgi:hypothetical protein
MKKGLLPAAGKNGVISKAVPSLNKVWRFYSGSLTLFIWHIGVGIPKHAQFRIIVQVGKMVDTSLACLAKDDEAHV